MDKLIWPIVAFMVGGLLNAFVPEDYRRITSIVIVVAGCIVLVALAIHDRAIYNESTRNLIRNIR